jgi:hypothetical protein
MFVLEKQCDRDIVDFHWMNVVFFPKIKGRFDGNIILSISLGISLSIRSKTP